MTYLFKNPLYSLDASTIDLCLSLYDWAEFRKTKGAVKIHVKLNHSDYLPTFMTMTEGKVHESTIAPNIPMEPGDVIVFDSGYNDFSWFNTLVDKSVFFVTRLKRKARYKVVERRPVNHKDIYSDHIIEFTGFYAKKNCPCRLRRIRSKYPGTGKIITVIISRTVPSIKSVGDLLTTQNTIYFVYQFIPIKYTSQQQAFPSSQVSRQAKERFCFAA